MKVEGTVWKRMGTGRGEGTGGGNGVDYVKGHDLLEMKTVIMTPIPLYNE